MASALLTISIVLWALTFAVGAVDGIYYHLFKLRLHARAESRREHLAHTARAVLLPVTLWVAFLAPLPSSPTSRLYVIGALVGADWLVAAWDVYLEKNSRRDRGGLPHLEYFVHVAVTALHSAAEAFVVAGWIAVASAGGDPIGPRSLGIGGVAWALVAGAALAAVVHLSLLLRRPDATAI